MLDYKKSTNWTMEEVYKNKLDIVRFRHDEVNFEPAFLIAVLSTTPFGVTVMYCKYNFGKKI